MKLKPSSLRINYKQLLLVSLFVCSYHNIFAYGGNKQLKSPFSLGGGFSYSFSSREPGLNIVGLYGITDIINIKYQTIYYPVVKPLNQSAALTAELTTSVKFANWNRGKNYWFIHGGVNLYREQNSQAFDIPELKKDWTSNNGAILGFGFYIQMNEHFGFLLQQQYYSQNQAFSLSASLTYNLESSNRRGGRRRR